MVIWVGDYRELEHELDRLERLPDLKMRGLLDNALEASFQLTQEAVHVESGALRASGKMESSSSRLTQTWEGEISYGDDGLVDYAIYEKRRGVHWVGPSGAKGDHDFMRPLDSVGPMFRAAILHGLGKHRD